MRKKKKKRPSVSKPIQPPKGWMDWIFLKRFDMFGNGKGWKDQPYSTFQFLLMCLNVEAGLQAEQTGKTGNKG